MTQKRICTHIQYAFANYIKNNLSISRLKAITTITHVEIQGDLKVAKIYLSFVPVSKQVNNKALLLKIEKEKYYIKKHLTSKLRQKLRHMPDLEFYIDNTAREAVKIEKILSSI